MKKLTFSQYAQVSFLFSNAPHNLPVIFSVLDGNQPGMVFADDVEHPTVGIVVVEDMVFFGGNPEGVVCAERIGVLFCEQIARGGIPFYELHPLQAAWYPLLEAAFQERIRVRRVRRTFAIGPDRFVQEASQPANLPEQYSSCPLDDRIYSQLPMPASFWAPETGRFGTAVVDGGKIASTCFAVFVGGGMAEVSIETEEAYRRQGLALEVTRAFFAACQARGLYPNWACWQEKEASAALAEKLGFVQSHRHEALVVQA